MAPVPNYAGLPKMWVGNISTQETATTSPTNIVSIVTGATSGTRIDRVVVQATANTAAGRVHLWLRFGTTWRIYNTVLVTAVTHNDTTPLFRAVLDGMALDIESAQEFGATTTIAQSLNVFAEGAHY